MLFDAAGRQSIYRRQRQTHRHGRPFVLDARNVDNPTVLFHNLFSAGKTEPRPRDTAGDITGAVKPLKNMGQIGGRNT